MKKSCSTKLLEAAGAGELKAAIDIAAEIGFDGINISVVDNEKGSAIILIPESISLFSNNALM